MQDCLAPFAKILFIFACPERTPTIFLVSFSTILKKLAISCELCQEYFPWSWQEKSEVQKFYSQEKQDTKHWGLKLSTSFVRIHFMLVRRKKSNTGFHDKNLKNPHLSLTSFCAILKILKAKYSSQINSCFYPMFAKWDRVNEPTLVDHVSEKLFIQLVANLP